jgi:phage replication O-like protein O
MEKKSGKIVYEDGTIIESWSQVDNEVLDKVAESDFTKAERKVLNRIIRDTIGWDAQKNMITGASVKRLSHDIPVKRFTQKTKLSADKVKQALDNLEKRQIIKRQGDKITFNHHLREWLTPKQVEMEELFKQPIEQKQAEQQQKELDSWLGKTS